MFGASASTKPTRDKLPIMAKAGCVTLDDIVPSINLLATLRRNVRKKELGKHIVSAFGQLDKISDRPQQFLPVEGTTLHLITVDIARRATLHLSAKVAAQDSSFLPIANQRIV